MSEVLYNKAVTVLELTKGFTPEQRKEMGNLLTTMEELAGDVMILEAERSEQVKEIERLKELLSEAKPFVKSFDHTEKFITDINRALNK